ncbi:MAG: molecular chaperone [Pseudomonadota bacterium]
MKKYSAILLKTIFLNITFLSAFAEAGSLAIWPIDPVIAQGEQATAIWIENKDTETAVLQLRIYDWSQQNGEELLEQQNNIVGSPPIMEIAAGDRQYIRIIRQGPHPTDTELAFRIIVDEIPVVPEENANAETAPGITMKMRYSFPLFTYGDGMEALDTNGGTEDGNPVADGLSHKVIVENGQRFLEITNSGKYHAQLKQVSFIHEDALSEMTTGLLGYVLAGSRNRWPIPDSVLISDVLEATVNNDLAQNVPHELSREVVEK